MTIKILWFYTVTREQCCYGKFARLKKYTKHIQNNACHSIAYFLIETCKHCQPLHSNSAYFIIFMLICENLVSKILDLFSINFALKFLIRSFRTLIDLRYGFLKAVTVTSLQNI